MCHAQAKLIPQTLWEKFFINELPDYLIPLMQEKDNDLFQILTDDLEVVSFSKKKKICIWLGIALSHPELNSESLHNIGDILGMSDKLMFDAAVYWGNKNYFKDLITKYSTSALHAMIAANHYNVFIESAEHGHLHILQYLEEQDPEKLPEMITSQDYLAFRLAAANDHLSVLLFLAEKNSEQLQEMITAENYYAFIEATKNGYLSVIQFLASLHQE